MALPAYAESPFLVPYHAAEKPIVDDQGRKSIIIDFVDDAHVNYPNGAALGWDKRSINRPQVLNLINDHAQRYGYDPKGPTSWVGSSVTAFLTDAQITRMRHDKDVKLLTEDRYVGFSSSPPWYDANPNGDGERRSWGTLAMNGKQHNGLIDTNDNRRVYLIDSGVGNHVDLPSVTRRINVGCDNAPPGGNCSTGLQDDAWTPVGCYAHATHVAGIISAVTGNGATTVGVYSGVEIRSIAMKRSIGENLGKCADAQPDPPATTQAQIGRALDYIFWETLSTGTQKVPVVNISMNPGGFGYEDATGVPQTNYYKLQQLNQPGYYTYPYWPYTRRYPGAFIAQSAGNNGVNVCSSYPSPAFRLAPSIDGTAVDGIMVVGALKSSGAPVDWYNPFSPPNPSNASSTVLSPSNYGKCVDIWAPGDAIVSTWGKHVLWQYRQTEVNHTPPYSGNPGFGTEGWAYLSGTSQAAPHIAAAAAYVADAYGLTTPAAIEQKLRDLAVWTGFMDFSNWPAYRTQLP